MNYLDFVIDHYIWFLMGGIVLLMTVIGYYAEKTEFGKKQPEKKQKKESPVIETPSPKREDAIIAEEEPMESLEPIDLEQVVDPEVLNEEVQQSDQQEEIPEELYVGLDGTPNTFKEETENTTEEESAEKELSEEVKETELELPNIEALKDDSYDGFNDDEDMWKF